MENRKKLAFSPQIRRAAKEAARRSGKSVEDWLSDVIAKESYLMNAEVTREIEDELFEEESLDEFNPYSADAVNRGSSDKLKLVGHELTQVNNRINDLDSKFDQIMKRVEDVSEQTKKSLQQLNPSQSLRKSHEARGGFAPWHHYREHVRDDDYEANYADDVLDLGRSARPTRRKSVDEGVASELRQEIGHLARVIETKFLDIERQENEKKLDVLLTSVERLISSGRAGDEVEGVLDSISEHLNTPDDKALKDSSRKIQSQLAEAVSILQGNGEDCENGETKIAIEKINRALEDAQAISSDEGVNRNLSEVRTRFNALGKTYHALQASKIEERLRKIDELQSEISQLGSKLEHMFNQASKTSDLDPLRLDMDKLRSDMGETLDSINSGALHSLEQQMALISHKLETPAKQDDELINLLNSRMDSIEAALANNENRFEVLSALEASLGEVIRISNKARRESEVAAEKIATRVVQETLNSFNAEKTGLSEEDQHALMEEINQLKRHNEESEKKLLQTINEVNNNLAKVSQSINQPEKGVRPVRARRPQANESRARRGGGQADLDDFEYSDEAEFDAATRDRKSSPFNRKSASTKPSGMPGSGKARSSNKKLKIRPSAIRYIIYSIVLFVLLVYLIYTSIFENQPVYQTTSSLRNSGLEQSLSADTTDLSALTPAGNNDTKSVMPWDNVDDMITGAVTPSLNESIPESLLAEIEQPEINASVIKTPKLLKAVQNKDPSATFELAMRFAEGRGVEQNYAEALKWLAQSASQGQAVAMYNIGLYYEFGRGTSKNIEKAKTWYRLAANAGNVRAMHNYALLLADDSSGNPNYQEAASWFLKAAQFGVIDSQYNYASLALNGSGTEIDLEEAYTWYGVAAKLGDQDARTEKEVVAERLPPSDRNRLEKWIEDWVPLLPIIIANEVVSPAGGWN